MIIEILEESIIGAVRHRGDEHAPRGEPQPTDEHGGHCAEQCVQNGNGIALMLKGEKDKWHMPGRANQAARQNGGMDAGLHKLWKQEASPTDVLPTSAAVTNGEAPRTYN